MDNPFASVGRRASFAWRHFMALGVALLLIILAIVLVAGCSSTATSTASASATGNPSSGGLSATHRNTGLAWTGKDVSYGELPVAAKQTIALIDAGGPFPYPRNDGVVYNNFNKALPKQARGYYHEYTVTTPGATNRGARRIIAARDGTLFYTADHYQTFARITA